EEKEEEETQTDLILETTKIHDDHVVVSSHSLLEKDEKVTSVAKTVDVSASQDPILEFRMPLDLMDEMKQELIDEGELDQNGELKMEEEEEEEEEVETEEKVEEKEESEEEEKNEKVVEDSHHDISPNTDRELHIESSKTIPSPIVLDDIEKDAKKDISTNVEVEEDYKHIEEEQQQEEGKEVIDEEEDKEESGEEEPGSTIIHLSQGEEESS
ncbi:hypothetical protein ADUPG1_001898, partial [Aduncisulcus paluster]